MCNDAVMQSTKKSRRIQMQSILFDSLRDNNLCQNIVMRSRITHKQRFNPNTHSMRHSKL